MFYLDKRIFCSRVWLLDVWRCEDGITLLAVCVMVKKPFFSPLFGLEYIRTLSTKLEADHSIHWMPS